MTKFNAMLINNLNIWLKTFYPYKLSVLIDLSAKTERLKPKIETSPSAKIIYNTIQSYIKGAQK